jgi:hypothetical protein
MADEANLDEAKLLAIVNARLDAELKESEIAEKLKPWKSLTNPITLMAILTGLTTLSGGTNTLLQSWWQHLGRQAEIDSAELSAERVVLQNIMQQAGPSLDEARTKITLLVKVGLLPLTKDRLIANGLVMPELSQKNSN